MANLLISQRAGRTFVTCCLIALVILSGCLSPNYPQMQQLLAQLWQQGIMFKADSPPITIGASPLLPPELYPLSLFVYIRVEQGMSLPPDHLFIYIAHTLEQADYTQSRIEDFARSEYGLRGIDLPPKTVLHYYRCDEVFVVYQVWGKPSVDPVVDKALTERCGPAFVRYPSQL